MKRIIYNHIHLFSRKEHDFPKKYLILSEMSANAVLMLDTITDKVYTVNLEEGDELRYRISRNTFSSTGSLSPKLRFT